MALITSDCGKQAAAVLWAALLLPLAVAGHALTSYLFWPCEPACP